MLRYSVVCDIFFFKQKTAYEMRISDWSSDVCSSDLPRRDPLDALQGGRARLPLLPGPRPAAAEARPGADRRAEGRPAGAARRQEGAVHARIRAVAVRRLDPEDRKSVV